MTQTTHIHQYNVNGDNIVAVGAQSTKIDGRLFVAALAVAAVALVGSTLYGMMVGAVAFGMWIAPYVAGGLLAAGTGIGGFALYKRRVLAQPLPAIEDVPAVVIEAAPVALPVQPRALRSAEVAELVEFYESETGRTMKEYEIDYMERQIAAQQPAAKVIPLCAFLSSPSESLPLRASQPGR